MARNVVVLVGSGSIGQAIVRRVGAGKHVVLADLKTEAAENAAKTLEDAGFEASAVQADLSSRESILSLIDHARQYGPFWRTASTMRTGRRSWRATGGVTGGEYKYFILHLCHFGVGIIAIMRTSTAKSPMSQTKSRSRFHRGGSGAGLEM